VLPLYPPDLSAKARSQLERLGVEVRLDSRVTEITDRSVLVGDEEIAAGNVFWAAGVAASRLGAALGAPVDRAGRVLVEPDCSVPGHPEVFVVGDLAAAFRNDGSPVPGVAQGALQMGEHVRGRSWRTCAAGRAHGSSTATRAIWPRSGAAAAVARLKSMKLSGFPAWLIWVVVHIMYLIGFRNRVLVMLQWAWGIADGHDLPAFRSAIERERVDAAMAEALAQMECVEGPDGRQVAIDADFRGIHLFIEDEIGRRAGDGAQEIVHRRRLNHAGRRDAVEARGAIERAAHHRRVAGSHPFEEPFDHGHDLGFGRLRLSGRRDEQRAGDEQARQSEARQGSDRFSEPHAFFSSLREPDRTVMPRTRSRSGTVWLSYGTNLRPLRSRRRGPHASFRVPR
jgi:hypothetical protein